MPSDRAHDFTQDCRAAKLRLQGSGAASVHGFDALSNPKEHPLDRAEKIKIAGVNPMNVQAPPGAVPMAVADLQNDDEKYWMQPTINRVDIF